MVAATGFGLSLLVLADSWDRRRPRPGAGRGPRDALDDFGAAPAFGLTDQLGRPVHSDELRGKVVVADFVYTACRDTCPLLSGRMQALQARLRQERLLGGRVQLLSFTVDPARDTPDVLRAYAERYGADADAWRFLTGPEGYLVPLVVGGFRLGAQPVPAGAPGAGGGEHGSGGPAGPYDVLHSNRFVLIDRRGRLRAYRDALDLDLDRLLDDIRRLLRS